LLTEILNANNEAEARNIILTSINIPEKSIPVLKTYFRIMNDLVHGGGGKKSNKTRTRRPKKHGKQTRSKK
jgi:hypothetical protein